MAAQVSESDAPMPPERSRRPPVPLRPPALGAERPWRAPPRHSGVGYIGSPMSSPRAARVIAASGAVVAAAGGAAFAAVVNAHYPIVRWLLWVHLFQWLWCILFMAACGATGWRVLGLLRAAPTRLDERMAMSLAIGVLVFAWGIFLIGLAHGLGKITFFALPLAMLAFGGRSVFRAARNAVRHLRRFGFRLIQPRTFGEGAAVALLAVGGLAVYMQVINPLEISADATWYHLPIAQNFATTGSVHRFPEGWYLGAYPHLASFLYTWALGQVTRAACGSSASIPARNSRKLHGAEDAVGNRPAPAGAGSWPVAAHWHRPRSASRRIPADAT